MPSIFIGLLLKFPKFWSHASELMRFEVSDCTPLYVLIPLVAFEFHDMVGRGWQAFIIIFLILCILSPTTFLNLWFWHFIKHIIALSVIYILWLLKCLIIYFYCKMSILFMDQGLYVQHYSTLPSLGWVERLSSCSPYLMPWDG